MKKSEELYQAAAEADSDFKALNLRTKGLREARVERFLEQDYSEQLIAKGCTILPFNGNKIVIDTQTDKFGVLDYFPKANKVLIRKSNQWKNQGLKWIKENILN